MNWSRKCQMPVLKSACGNRSARVLIRRRPQSVRTAGEKRNLETTKPRITGPCGLFLAESQGFEPWELLPVQRISNPSRSTTPATLQSARIITALLDAAEGVSLAVSRALRPDAALPLHRLQLHRPGPGGSDPCPFSCLWPYPTGGNRQG